MEILKNVETGYQRLKELYDKGSATQQQFDDISTQLSVARNQLVVAKAQHPILDAKTGTGRAAIRLIDSRIKYSLGGIGRTSFCWHVYFYAGDPEVS